MGSFRYRAVDEAGAAVAGTLVADSAEDARARLREMRLFPERVERAERMAARLLDRLPGPRARVMQHVTVFTRQFAILLASGVPAVSALGVLASQCEHRGLSQALHEAAEGVNSGRSLAESMAGYPQFFDRSYVGMVASGEKSGAMDTVFMRLADFLERRRQMQARLTTALIYPAILLAMVFGLLIFLSGYVVPVIKPLLQQHHRPLPLTTQLLFRLGDLVRGFAWMVLPAAAAAVGALVWWRRSERRRGAMDAWMLRVPILGKLWLKSLVARFAMTFSTLLRTGVPALEALEVLEGIVPNAAFSEEIGRIRRDVTEGKEISARMQASALFPPMVGYMVAVGERSGSLADVLEHVSDAYEQEVDVTSRRLLAALEPALVLLMAGVVGFIATSLMVTILELSHI